MATLRFPLSTQMTFKAAVAQDPDVVAQAGEVVVFTTPSTLQVQHADASLAAIDVTANLLALLGTVAPQAASVRSYVCAKALRFNDAKLSTVIGDTLVFTENTLMIFRAGALVGCVDYPAASAKELVLTGVLTPVA